MRKMPGHPPPRSAVAPLGPAGSPPGTSTESAAIRLIRRVISTGRVAISHDPRLLGVRAVFDLSKRAIVPIVSPVKTDPAPRGSALQRSGARATGDGVIPG